MIDIIGIQMDRDTNVRLQKLARHHNCTVDDLIVEAVKEYYADEFHRAEQTEPQTSKIIEAYSRGFKDGADAVKAMPQTDGYMTAEQAEDYRKMLDKAEHKVYGNIEDEPQTDCSWK